MSMAPENAKERRFQYETDPSFNMVMDSFCRMAVEDDNDNRMNIALDFFLYGIAIVVADDSGISLFDPEHCSEAEGGVRVKPLNMDEIIVPALVIKVKEEHPPPCIEFGMIRNVDPWLEEWERADAELEGFLQERLSR